MAVAFKLKHGIHHMLQHFWPGQRAFFSNMADEKDRRLRFFGKLHYLTGTFAHLAYTTRGRLYPTGL